MRVLYLADAVVADQPGGAYVVADELARQLASRGYDITFLVPRHNTSAAADERVGDIRIVRYEGSGQHFQFLREGQQAAAKLWQEKPFDIVHTHFAYASEGPSKSFPAGVRHVRTFHGPWHLEGEVEDTARLKAAQGVAKGKAALQRALKWKMRLKTEQSSLSRSQAIIVHSNYMRGEVLKLDVPQDKVHMMYGGVDTDRFVPLPEGRAAARQRLGLPQEQDILFTVRRLAPRMGLDNLLEAMKIVVASSPNVLLLIGGKGPEAERLQRLIGEYNLQNHVRLLGFIPDDQLADYYRAADLFVLPTLALEGFGLVTVEALSSGTPALATPIGASPEILEELDKRLLTKSTNPTDFAAAILDFLAGSWRNTLTPQQLHDFVLARYTWQRNADAVETIYRQLCS